MIHVLETEEIMPDSHGIDRHGFHDPQVYIQDIPSHLLPVDVAHRESQESFQGNPQRRVA